MEDPISAEIVDLSSDDDDANGNGSDQDDDVALLTVKPKAKSMKINADDVEAEEELESGGADINMEAKEGFVKELIDGRGLGMLLGAGTSGLVLFHASSCYKDGEPLSDNAWRASLQPGTQVNFIDQFHEGDEFNCLSSAGVLRQAVVVWIGARPAHLFKKIREDENAAATLKRHRTRFIELIKANKFMHVPIVRAKGNITGYLTPDLGLIESDDCGGDKTNMIVFHAQDVFIYRKKPIRPVEEMLPVGLRVYFDARDVLPFRNITYQACNVFAGSWPEVPHPTVLNQGPASRAPCYDLDPGEEVSFYYLDLTMEDKLNASWEKFSKHADEKGTQLRKARTTVDNIEDSIEWQKRYSPFDTVSMKKRPHKRRYHEFKRDDKIVKSEAEAQPETEAVKSEEPAVKREKSQQN